MKEDKKSSEEFPEDEDIYTDEGRQELLEEGDEITDVEEGFMQGYEKGEKLTTCSECRKPLERDVIEEDFDGELFRFCSARCASYFEKKKKEE